MASVMELFTLELKQNLSINHPLDLDTHQI